MSYSYIDEKREKKELLYISFCTVAHNLQQYNNYHQYVDENVKPSIGLIGCFFGGVKDLYICSN